MPERHLIKTKTGNSEFVLQQANMVSVSQSSQMFFLNKVTNIPYIYKSSVKNWKGQPWYYSKANDISQ